MCTFLGLKVKSAICDRTPPPTCTPNVVNMNAQVFRDPKSSNRIDISRFIKFLLTFDWFQGSTPHGGARAHTYMYKHDNFMQMAAPIGKSWGIPLWHHRSYVRAHVCICVHVCMCVGIPLNTLTESYPHLPTPTPRGVDPRNQSKVNKNLMNRDISILFEDVKFVDIPHQPTPTTTPTHPTHPRGGPLICWNVIKLEWIKIIQFCLKIYDL